MRSIFDAAPSVLPSDVLPSQRADAEWRATYAETYTKAYEGAGFDYPCLGIVVRDKREGDAVALLHRLRRRLSDTFGKSYRFDAFYAPANWQEALGFATVFFDARVRSRYRLLEGDPRQQSH